MQALARRRVVLFLGSGVSANATGAEGQRPPTWERFLSKAIGRIPSDKTHITRLLRSGDFLTVCEIVKNRLGDDWDEVLKESFIEPQFSPADVHRAIFKLDQRVCLTQNFDAIYDTFAASESNNTVQIKQYHDEDIARFVTSRERFVVKAHGSLANRSRMIFTRNDYYQARHACPEFYRILDALAITSTFLFIGCGVSDPDVQLMLSSYRHGFRAGPPHYFLTQKGKFHDDLKKSIQANFGLKLIEYGKKANHGSLPQELGILSSIVESVRDELADSQQW